MSRNSSLRGKNLQEALLGWKLLIKTFFLHFSKCDAFCAPAARMTHAKVNYPIRRISHTLRMVMMQANRSRFNSSINTTRHILQLSRGPRSGDNGSAQREKFRAVVGSEVFSDNGSVTCWSCYLWQTLQITHSLCENFNNKEPAPYRTTLTRRRISFINFALFVIQNSPCFGILVDVLQLRCTYLRLYLTLVVFASSYTA